jgi:hypothetical protein
LSHSTLPIGETCYYIATDTADGMLSGISAKFNVVVTGTSGRFDEVSLMFKDSY